MTFDEAALDGGDPSYSPCLHQVRDTWYWRCPPRYVRAGYSLKNVPLGGKVGDGNHLARAARCRALTKEMLRWYEGVEMRRMPGTWGELIGRYQTDGYSTFQDVKSNTRVNYREHLAYWEKHIGHVRAEQTTYAFLRELQKTMEKNGRSVHFIHAKFTQLRTTVRHGVALDPQRWGPVKEILGQMRLTTPSAKKEAPTRAQVMAVVEKADEAGHHGFALGLLMQFYFALRPMDVRGDWFPVEGGRRRWADGITWDMIDKDVTRLRKVASKTIRSNPRAMEFNLTLVPEIRERLLRIENRVGPVILSTRGVPYDQHNYAEAWAKFRDAAGVPKHIKVMDLRAGAATEAEAMGADMRSIQIALNHAQGQTTERYTRGKDDIRNRVIEMRAKK